MRLDGHDDAGSAVARQPAPAEYRRGRPRLPSWHASCQRVRGNSCCRRAHPYARPVHPSAYARPFSKDIFPLSPSFRSLCMVLLTAQYFFAELNPRSHACCPPLMRRSPAPSLNKQPRLLILLKVARPVSGQAHDEKRRRKRVPGIFHEALQTRESAPLRVPGARHARRQYRVQLRRPCRACMHHLRMRLGWRPSRSSWQPCWRQQKTPCS